MGVVGDLQAGESIAVVRIVPVITKGARGTLGAGIGGAVTDGATEQTG